MRLDQVELKPGMRCNWSNQPERLVYLGKERSWHQFALVSEPGEVWCEVLEGELQMLELTVDANQKAIDALKACRMEIRRLLEIRGYSPRDTAMWPEVLKADEAIKLLGGRP